MMQSFAFRLAAALLAVAAAAPALAQNAACERYRSELASLGRSGASARSAEATAQRHQAEIARLTSYHRSIGCGQAGFFFQAPAECGAMTERIRALQASIGAVSSQAYDPAAGDARRRQLRAAIARSCESPEGQQAASASERSVQAKGGDRTVCVRTCDGYFFPLENRPQGRASEASLCKALCPGAEAAVYRAPRDGGIEQALSENGKPYMQLANALRYQKAHDPSCSCKPSGDSWAKSLQKAEGMIASSRTDIVVTPGIADRLARVASAGSHLSKAVSKTPAEATLVAKQAVDDVETTGSVVTEEASNGPERPRARVIAPDQIPAPGVPIP